MKKLDCNIDKVKNVFDVTSILDEYHQQLKASTYYHLGYPYHLDYDYTVLNKLVDYSINNLGDPFIPSNYGIHSRPFEIAVIEWFAKLWRLDDFWGYVTACGTEGNLHGILLGRENLLLQTSSATGEQVVLLGSTACHYSVWKVGRMYCMEVRKIQTLETDEIDYKELRKTLTELKEAGKKVVMVANIGSTVRGAVDNAELITLAFVDAGFTPQLDFQIHLDGALFGMMAPFIDAASHIMSFANPAVCSISVSGHKMIGTNCPCGVVLTRKSQISALSQDIAYIGSRDATILGSRNGHAPLFLWYAIVKKGIKGFRDDVEKCMKNARYLYDKLRAAGIKNLLLNDLSSTVVFQRPSNEEFVLKWQLACEGNIAHAVVMPNVDKNKIDEFVAEYILCHDCTDSTSA